MSTRQRERNTVMNKAYWILALALALGCNDDNIGDSTDGDPPVEDTEDEPDPPDTDPVETSGMVFSLSNDADGNAVLAYARNSDGTLDELGTFPTGGLGTGQGIGSQGPLAVSEDHQYLYVVNPGSNDISGFQIFDDHLSLISITDSGGLRPVSVTLRGNRLYVVNADDSSVQGYAVEDGWLIEIAGASQSLSTTESATAPAQIGLSPRSDVLVVTEKATNVITTFSVSIDGSLSEPIVTDSEGMTPFGFDFTDSGALVVSEAFGGADNASAASSYQVNPDASLTVISSSVGSGQSAACWVLIDGDTAYATNTKSNNVSEYLLDSSDQLTLDERNEGIATSLGDGRRPIDMALAGGFLYVLNAGTDNIVAFSPTGDGPLTQIDDDLAASTATGLLGF
jgi:6-phosphogluconolactonase (cycloisomerase 2 family)